MPRHPQLFQGFGGYGDAPPACAVRGVLVSVPIRYCRTIPWYCWPITNVSVPNDSVAKSIGGGAAEGPDSQAGVGLRGDGRSYLLTLNLNSAVTPYPLAYPVAGTGVIPGEAVVGWRVGVPGQYRNPLRNGTERRSDDHHGRELIGDIIYRCILLRLSIRSYRITHNRYRFPINPVVQPRPSSHHPHNRRRSSRRPGVAPLVEWCS